MENSEESVLGIKPRLAAWDVLLAVGANAYADSAMERVLNKYQLNDLDRSLVKEISYGAIRYRLLLDGWVDSLAKIPSYKQPPPLRWLLHLGLYQIFYMNRIPAAAAVNTCVEAIKTRKMARLAPVVNAVLRSAIRVRDSGEKLPIPKDLAARISKEYSLPIWLAKELIVWRGKDGAEEMAFAFNQVPSIDLRVNRIKTNPASLKAIFSSNGIESDFIKSHPDGLIMASGAGDIRNWPRYFQGEWTIQDRSSQWVSSLLDPDVGEKVLDACAAPGGKTTHIAEIMNNSGEIWAIDRSRVRLEKVIQNSQRLGLKNIKFLAADSIKLLEVKPSWRNYFNRILLDAPCSGLGTLARNPDARWRMNQQKIKELVQLQFNLLEGLLPLLMPGGRFVYSTCTIHPDENSDQIRGFLNRHPKLTLLYEKQRWPGQRGLGDGFYVAVLELAI